ncbi:MULTISPECIES: helix-turn-helix domain-containing protein [Actinosynnema]|uniref:helix-turn-helix domain-containing protein n=1 Tax=Actinosynnema TaxID=40566 RepID=UPI0020A574A6|nr:helix-turn-helix domain-containing protein [Actinosynnema pretiosum]
MTATAGSAERADDVVALVRLAAQPDAVGALLDWLARRTGGTAVLLDAGGRTLAAPARRSAPHPSALVVASAAVAVLHRDGVPSAVLGGADGAIDVVRLDAAGGAAPYLVVAGRPGHGAPLADAARILGLAWRVALAERVASALAQGREAVLHLLMIGSLAAARRIAATLGPGLPDMARVHVVECPPGRRSQVADQVERFARGRAWIVPCPVRPRHLIALVPPRREQRDRPDLDRLIAEHVPEARTGVSQEVPLSETALGYEQAFHALALARGVPGRCARFDRDADLTPFLGAGGPSWAAGFLAPCLTHVPARRADPGAEELLATLNSWIAFDTGASRHLKIHRNTLSARLRLLEALLGLDLTSVADQSAAWLALRLHTTHRAGAAATTPGPAGELDGLLATPVAGVWARSRLRPIDRAGVETVLAWLRADARLPATASALAISAPATRKRLTKVERALGRSLLHAPSAKHELWLAPARARLPLTRPAGSRAHRSPGNRRDR